ncbi:MAG TPA: VTT domain-containing protein [Hyphomonadaceae bacterium]|nr:VTT domain-containing protein [Hyphomonadaceae bacterium]
MTETPAPARKGWPVPPALIAWGLGALAIIIGVSWAASSGLITWSMAVDARNAARGFVAAYAPLAYAIYVFLFVAMAVTLFPAQLWIIVFGAMLFGFWPSLIVSWLASVAAGTLVFLMARGMFKARYHARAGKYLTRIEEGFHKDELIWMLLMRFIPVVPFCVSNVAPGLLGARLRPFLIATLVGTIPYVLAYTFAGAQAGEVFDDRTPPDVAHVAAQMLPIMLAIAALPVLALTVKRIAKR